MAYPVIIAIDGHDGSGKTTISKLLAEKINAKYIKPFSDSLGDLIAWSYRKKEYKFANQIALAAIQKNIDENPGVEYFIFDRHWLSMFTVLPKEYYEYWNPLPVTILCWADVKTTQNRLIERNEIEPYQGCNEHYCKVYKEIAGQYNVFIVDTSNDSKTDDRVSEIFAYLVSNQLI
ncbi:cytidylate kinase [compost metagenome]